MLLRGIALVTLLLSAGAPPLTRIARVEDKPIDEMSGIARSDRYPGIFWVHNDSGDTSRLFAIKLNGEVVVPRWMNRREDAGVAQTRPAYEGLQVQNASNFDWEDITSDGENLYIGDVGNNGNARRDLGVYVLPEPNPFEVDKAKPITWLPIAFPDQREFPPERTKAFDCESIFWLNGKLHFLTKWRDAVGLPLPSTALYRLDTRFSDRVNVLKRIDEKSGLGGWVTAADVSPDGTTLAVLTQAPVASVWLFPTKAKGGKILSGAGRQIVFTDANQCEAVTWRDNNALIITNEQRDIFSLPVRDVKID